MKINEILAAIEWVEEWIHRNGLINIKLIFRIQIFSPRDAFYFDAINQCAQVFELPKKPVCSPQLFSFFSLCWFIYCSNQNTNMPTMIFKKKKHRRNQRIRALGAWFSCVHHSEWSNICSQKSTAILTRLLFPRKLANNLQDAKKNLLSRTFGSSTWTRNRIFEHKIRMKYRRENSDSM